MVMKFFLFTVAAAIFLALGGCRGNDAEPGKVVVTQTKALGKKDIVSTPRPK
jgi:hypothetical protein